VPSGVSGAIGATMNTAAVGWPFAHSIGAVRVPSWAERM
jgi:hypothetical protein